MFGGRKMRQAIKSNHPQDNAISAVVGVILMVAIVVIVAATIYVSLSSLSTDNTAQSTTIGFNVDNVNNQFIVSSTSIETSWSGIKIKADNSVWVTANGNLAQVTVESQNISTLFNLTGIISAGESFTISANYSDDVKFTLIHENTNTIAGIVNMKV